MRYLRAAGSSVGGLLWRPLRDPFTRLLLCHCVDRVGQRLEAIVGYPLTTHIGKSVCALSDLLQRTLDSSESLNIARYQIAFLLEDVEPLRVILVLLYSRAGLALDISFLGFCCVRGLTQLIPKLVELPPLAIEIHCIGIWFLIAHCCLLKIE